MEKPARSNRIFQFFLRLFPAEFRGDFGGEMAQEWPACCRRGGRPRLIPCLRCAPSKGTTEVEEKMSKRTSPAMLLAAMMGTLLAAPCAHAQCTPSSPAPPDTSTIRNFLRVNKDFCTGGQPRLEHLESLKKEGVVAVINLRTPGEHRAAEEEEMAKKVGLKYFNIPVVYTDPKDAEVDEFLKITDDPKNRPAFIHCTAAIRVGAFWMIRRVMRDNFTVEDAQKEAEKVGLRNAPHLNDFVRAYLARHKPAAAAVQPAPAIPIAIEGLDPVLLVAGKEVQGDPKISLVHERFEYLGFQRRYQGAVPARTGALRDSDGRPVRAHGRTNHGQRRLVGGTRRQLLNAIRVALPTRELQDF